jgi:hypothetical protein
MESDIDPEHAELVADMLRHYLDGLSCHVSRCDPGFKL